MSSSRDAMMDKINDLIAENSELKERLNEVRFCVNCHTEISYTIDRECCIQCYEIDGKRKNHKYSWEVEDDIES